tara:strand:- start:1814 stop:2863 length:1050 start_codon:yes stop_codon:yes gene_type:complete
MKIFITGGCGFIGSNFILNNAKSLTNKILNLDKLTYAGNITNLISIKDSQNYHFIEGDICDKDIITKIFHDFQPDAVVHFAAESHVDRSIDEPSSFIQTNIVGTTVLLESALQYWQKSQNSVFKFLHVSTDEVYGSLNDHDNSFTEDKPYKPNSPYSASKAGSDHLVRAWYQTYGLPTLITNCSNNYGPYQFPEKLIPLIIANCIDEKNLPLYGDGLNIRDWLYVDDHCNAINRVLNDGQIGQTYNIGGNNEMKNIDIVTMICEKLDEIKPRFNGKSYKKLITFVEDRPGHDYRYAIDISKIKKDLSWQPKHSFKKGIEKTIVWYLDNEDWWRKIQNSNYNQKRLGLNK